MSARGAAAVRATGAGPLVTPSSAVAGTDARGSGYAETCTVCVVGEHPRGGAVMPGGVDNEAGSPPSRQRQIVVRLDAVRGRLQELRDRDAAKNLAATTERVEAANRHAAEAHAAALRALASSAHAFRRSAEAHERVASMHRRAGGEGTGDVRKHERQAALHRAAAAAARQRAEHAESLLSEPRQAGPAAISA